MRRETVRFRRVTYGLNCGKGGQAAGEVRLTGFVEFGNRNKQSFQREDIGDKFFHTNGLWIYTVLTVCVCLCLSELCETKRSGTFSGWLSV